MKDKGIQMLLDTLKTPKMYAYTKEGLLMRVSTILELISDDIDLIIFYKKHNGYTNIDKQYSDEWATLLIVDALELVK